MAARALRAGTVALPWWREAVAAVGRRRQGALPGVPVGSVFAAMATLGLGADFEQWGPIRAAPDGRRPLERPRSETLR
eukprot:7510829-Lingulodinium_polyedra.AAC.1